MKKMFSLGLVLVCFTSLFGLVSCKNNDLLEIAIVQYVTADALDNAREGIIEGLKENGFVDGENIKITVHNPQADASTLAQMAEIAVRKSDLIFAIATPVAQALKAEAESQGSDVPIIFTAVTDPLAAGLVDSNEVPGGNVTGTNDMNPVAEQVALMMEFATAQSTPKKLGVIYTASEKNSEVQVGLVRAAAEKLGIEVVTQTITSVNDIQTMTRALINSGVDTIYLPTDNAVSSAVTSVTNETNSAGIRTICGEEGMVFGGGTVTLGINYFNLGKITGKMASNVLNGASTADMAVQSLTVFRLVINKKVADESGIVIPQSLLDKADQIITE